MMSTITKRIGVYCLALAMVVSTTGCETMGPLMGGDTANLTPAERQLREDETKFRNTVIGGVATVAVMGAVAGALFAGLMGGNSRDMQRGAIAGAVAGGIAGGMDGYATAKMQQAGQQQVRAIEAAVVDIQQDNARLEQMIASSDLVLKEGQQRLASIKSDLTAGKVNAKQAEDARKREENNIAVLNKALEKARETRSEYAKASQQLAQGNPNAGRNLDAEIARTDRQIAQLERNLSEYSRALAVSRA